MHQNIPAIIFGLLVRLSHVTTSLASKDITPEESRKMTYDIAQDATAKILTRRIASFLTDN